MGRRSTEVVCPHCRVDMQEQRPVTLDFASAYFVCPNCHAVRIPEAAERTRKSGFDLSGIFAVAKRSSLQDRGEDS